MDFETLVLDINESTMASVIMKVCIYRTKITKGNSLTVDESGEVGISSTGLDNILTTEPSGRATTFREMMVQLYMRFFNKVDKDANNIKTYDSLGNIVTTQSISDDDQNQTVNKA